MNALATIPAGLPALVRNAAQKLAPCASERVYIAQNMQTGAVKIGFSANVRSRIASLEGAAGTKLDVLRLIEGGASTERWMHRRFAELRIFGEWFEFAAEMLTVIPPDELPRVPQTVKRRDVRLTLTERLRDTLALSNEIGLKPKDAVLMLSTKLSQDEAALVLSVLEEAFHADALEAWHQSRAAAA